MVASFADGTKISFEQAIIANATGMGVARRGMIGPEVAPGTPIDEAAKLFPQDLLLEGDGIVDYVIGAAPAPGVFVLGTIADPVQCHYLDLYKMGEGPIYCFYTPYHLCHFEVPATIARAVLFGDATIAPAGPPRVEVVATAKIDLEAGRVLDEIGHYTTYGECENAEIVRCEGLLPIGLAADCRVTRPLKRGEVIRQRDVEMPKERPIDRLRAEQEATFGGS
jgi:predicted homoserine dehydrogenase-like protein